MAPAGSQDSVGRSRGGGQGGRAPRAGENYISQDALRGACRGGAAASPRQSFLGIKKKKKVAKEKKESKPQASRLGIASEPGQVIIDDE